MKQRLNNIKMSINGQPIRPGSCWAHFVRKIPDNADKYELNILQCDLVQIVGESDSMVSIDLVAKQSDHWMNSFLRLDRDETVDAIKWIVLSVDAIISDVDKVIVRGRCRPFIEKYSHQ